MDSKRRISTTKRLIFGFGVVIFIFVLSAVVSISDIRKVFGLTRTIYNHPLVVSNASLRAANGIVKMHRSMKDVVLFDDRAVIEESIQKVELLEQEVFGHLNQVRDNILGSEGKQLEMKTRMLFENWKPIRQEVIELVSLGRRIEAAQITKNKGAEHVDLLETQMLALTAYARNKATQFMANAETIGERVSRNAITMMIVGISLSILTAFFTVRLTVRAEKQAAESEKRLRHMQKMEAIGTLTAGIAHEFNNKLSVIIGYVDLALEDTSETNPVRANLKEIKAAGFQVRDIIRQLIRFSRISKTDKINLDPVAAIQQTIELLRASIPKTVEVRFEISNTISSLDADADMIRQLVLNLAINAAQAIEGEGKIAIGLETEILDKKQASLHPELNPGKYVKITVSDNGAGIKASLMEKIFDPFFTTREVGDGSGLGLTVAHGIVSAHGGAILVDSQLGKGSVFTVYLPCQGDAQSAC